MRHQLFTAAAVLALLAGCSRGGEEAAGNAEALANAPAGAPSPTPAPSGSPTPVAATGGFDPAKAPVANPTLGGFPFFGLLDGYKPVDPKDAGEWTRGNQRDAAYDHYEFFDGTKLITVEGRLRTVEAVGTGASLFQVQKNYEKLIHDAGGVTVWEGSGEVMKEAKLAFAEPRHRARYNMLPNEKMGVYMVRTPTREIWVEIYQIWDEKPDNYYLTIVEKKNLEVTARLVPAEAMKKALDASGHVALYVNFDTDKTAIKPDSQPVLAEVVRLLEGDPSLKLTIEGHTDDAGTPAHNQTLSQGRANAVMGTLIAGGIDPGRLGAKGFGQTKPVGDNATEDGRAKNRRVELVKR